MSKKFVNSTTRPRHRTSDLIHNRESQISDRNIFRRLRYYKQDSPREY
jgi:hypothetical protein